MKKFIVNCGRKIIDISAYIWLFLIISLIIIGIITIICGLYDSTGDILSVGCAILFGSFIAFLSFIFTYFLIYLALNINDLLSEINEKLSCKNVVKSYSTLIKKKTSIPVEEKSNEEILDEDLFPENKQNIIEETLKDEVNEYHTNTSSDDEEIMSEENITSSDDDDDDGPDFLNRGIYRL